MEVTPLEEQELTQLKALQEQQNGLVNAFGSIEYQIQSLELQKEKLIENLENIKKKEVELASILNKKYGDGVIDLEKGNISKQ